MNDGTPAALPKPPRRFKLSVVIGTFNRLDALRRCIESILRETRTPTIIYVTDAGSTDGTQEYLQTIACQQVRPLLIGKKLGQAKALNDVFREVQTPYVAWLSDDNEVVDRGLDVAVDILKGCRRIGMVGLKVRDVQGPFVAAPYIGGLSAIGILNVNQGMLRTEVLREVGYFSETFAFYGIDPDLTAMVLFAGHDVVYTKQVCIQHYRDWPAEKGSPAFLRHQQMQKRSLELYMAKYARFQEEEGAWATKKRFWAWLKTKLGPRYAPNSQQRVFGGIARDWNNAMNGRFIHAIDPWLMTGRTYHLRQRVPRQARPLQMPVDPILTPQDA